MSIKLINLNLCFCIECHAAVSHWVPPGFAMTNSRLQSEKEKAYEMPIIHELSQGNILPGVKSML